MDLAVEPLALAIRRYVFGKGGHGLGWRQDLVNPYDDVCRTHYEAAASDLDPAAGVRYRDVIIDLDFQARSDAKVNLRDAIAAATRVCAVLDTHDVRYRVVFTGSKGLSLVIPGACFWPMDGSGFTFVPFGNAILRRLIRIVCAEAGVDESTEGGWDPAVYNERAPIRICGMPNSKSRAKWGRTKYRTLLPRDWQKLSVDEMLALAEVPVSGPRWERVARNAWLESLWAGALIDTAKDDGGAVLVFGDDRVKLAKKAQGYPPCIQSIRDGAIRGYGHRNDIGIPVAAYHASAGDTVKEAIETMRRVPTRGDIDWETRAQWKAIAAGRNRKKYLFSSRSCHRMRALGAACTDQCPLYSSLRTVERSKGPKAPERRPYEWGDDKREVVGAREVAPRIRDLIISGSNDILCTATPGGGKTTGAAWATPIAQGLGQRVMYSAPTHDLGLQFAGLVPGASIKRGRDETNCIRHGLATRVAARGWSAVKEVCLGCEHFIKHKPMESTCGWWQQWSEGLDRPWVVTHAHLATTFPQQVYEPTVVIMDEDPLAACLGWAGGLEDGFTSDELCRLPNAADKSAADDLATAYALTFWDWKPTDGVIEFTFGTDGGPGPVAELAQLLGSRLRALEAGKHVVNGFWPEGDRGVQGIDAAALLLLREDARRPVADPEVVGCIDRIVALRWDSADYRPDVAPDRLPPNLLRPLLQVLRAGRQALDLRAAGKPQVAGAIPIRIKPEAQPDGTKVCRVAIRTFTPLDLDAGGEHARVVALDATGDVSLLARAIGRSADDIDRADVVMPTVGTICQVTDVRLPMATVMASQNKAKLWEERISRLAERQHEVHGGVLLVVTYKVIADALRGRWKGDPRFRVGHFYGLRGQDHVDVSAMLMVGYPSPNPSDVLLDAAALYEGVKDLDTTVEEVFRSYLEQGKMAEAEHLGLLVTEPKDPRVRALWRARSDAELWQDAHRPRPGRRAEAVVYVVTQVPFLVEYREPVVLGTLRALEGGAKERKLVSEGVHDLAEHLRGKLGWVSLRLLEIVLRGDVWASEAGDPPQGYFAAGTVYGSSTTVPAGKSKVGVTPMPTFNDEVVACPRVVSGLAEMASLLRDRHEIRPMTPRRISEAWNSYVGATSWFEVTRSGTGRGRPRKDSVIGSLDAWILDHENELREPSVVVRVDGRPVGPADVEQVWVMSRRPRIVRSVGWLDGEADEVEPVDHGVFRPGDWDEAL